MMNKTIKKIKIGFIKNNTSGAEVARKLGVHRTFIYHVMTGKAKTLRIRKAISKATGISVSDLWPN